MKVEIPYIILIILLFVLDWLFDGIDFKSFLLGVGSTFFAFNYKEIFKWKR